MKTANGCGNAVAIAVNQIPFYICATKSEPRERKPNQEKWRKNSKNALHCATLLAADMLVCMRKYISRCFLILYP